MHILAHEFNLTPDKIIYPSLSLKKMESKQMKKIPHFNHPQVATTGVPNKKTIIPGLVVTNV